MAGNSSRTSQVCSTPCGFRIGSHPQGARAPPRPLRNAAKLAPHCFRKLYSRRELPLRQRGGVSGGVCESPETFTSGQPAAWAQKRVIWFENSRKIHASREVFCGSADRFIPGRFQSGSGRCHAMRSSPAINIPNVFSVVFWARRDRPRARVACNDLTNAPGPSSNPLALCRLQHKTTKCLNQFEGFLRVFETDWTVF